MSTEPKPAEDQSSSESETAAEKWERFKNLARRVLSITKEEAEDVRKHIPEPKDKQDN